MNTASARVWRRWEAQAAKVPGVLAARCRSLMKSIARQSDGATNVGVAWGSGSAMADGVRAPTPGSIRRRRWRA
jgi:hypothetical protein